jgi:hypothetical protein
MFQSTRTTYLKAGWIVKAMRLLPSVLATGGVETKRCVRVVAEMAQDWGVQDAAERTPTIRQRRQR